MRALLLFLALLSAPSLTAFWDGTGRAVISWQQSERACLYRNETFIGCYDGAGRVVVRLGGANTDAKYRPAAQDVYSVVSGDVITRAPLVARPVYLSMVRR